ncbi:MAG: UDP-N-acetylmuramoyl-tripeptide--D-alanyl-D-alanine ligase [Planctomycetota bacterium]|nr:MAG: UDP-N-acetylmuramoyl-tripeptide--D-alanyl-D-alanine ligase [Planctomycetota bacterium]
MFDLTVKKLHEIVGGRLRLATLPPRGGEQGRVRDIVVDSRQVRRGDVFWGLPGTCFDGSQFAGDAYARGAEGAVVGQKYVQPSPGCWSLEVSDAAKALWQLARWNRERQTGRVVAVTGSVGKTTARQMIRAVLERQLCGTSSPKNYNNHVGLPLSMLAMDPRNDFAVLEMAANAPGEIARLAGLCQPQIGVITRTGDAHLGGFGSLEGVAAAKAELLDALPEDGHAVLFGDDPRLRKVADRCRAKILWFGRSIDNDVVATHVESGHGRLSFEVDGTSMSVAVWGRHHLPSALAAVAVGRIFGMRDVEISRGLAEFEPPPMRCQIVRTEEATIIDDTYNASPVAMRAALDLLRDFEAPGRRVVVCGDMRELGPDSARLHRLLGDQIVTHCGADLLLACGQFADDVVAGARAAGMPHLRAVAIEEVADLAARCEGLLRPGDVVLVKGSRALAMERVVASLAAPAVSCAT